MLNFTIQNITLFLFKKNKKTKHTRMHAHTHCTLQSFVRLSFQHLELPTNQPISEGKDGWIVPQPLPLWIIKTHITILKAEA